MLIRQSQFASFSAAAEQHFEREMVEHLSRFAPELARVAGTAGITNAVQLGISRARSYGFTTHGPVRLYLELMCSLGSDFDSDPQYPWAGAALQDLEYPDQTWRASQLYRASATYFESVAGPNDTHALNALKNARRANMLGDYAPGGLTEAILARFDACYPQKYRYVGAEHLRPLISRSLQISEAHGICSGRYRAFVAAVLFGFGHGALTDPLYAWIGKALGDTLVTNPEDRAERLYRRLEVYIDHIIQTLA
ncbi:MAG: hypothetical protein ABSH09_07300 [Bryobacteraceae bacterium]|jgi:hypothetical protein